MSFYRYSAKDSTGNTVRGNIEANTLEAFYSELRSRGLYCLDVRELAESAVIRKTIYKMRSKALVLFCRKLGTMLNAGLSITGSLDILYTTETKPLAKQLLIAIYECIQRGMSLSEAMIEQGEAFPTFLISMTQSGEVSGSLSAIMLSLSQYYEREYKLLNKVKSAMMYPIILLCVSVGVIILLFAFVLPEMLSLFADQDLPPITRFVMGISDFITTHYLIIIAVSVVFITIFVNSKKITPLQYFLDKMKLTAPIFGNLNKQVYSSRFSRSMSMLYASGISLISCLQLTGGILENLYIANKYDDFVETVSTGDLLSNALAQLAIFDILLPSMIKIGEESGSLEGILRDVSDYYDEESETAIQRMVALIEPIMLVVLAIIIGTVLIAVIIPMYDMGSVLT